MVLHFDESGFDTSLKQNKLVLVDFWATWCGPCRMMAPVVEELAADFEGKVAVGKVDVDEEADLAQRYGIMSIPTLILFKDGKPVEQIVGARPKAAVAAVINNHIG